MRELKRAGKPIQKCLNEEQTIIYLTLTFPNRRIIRVNTHEKVKPGWWNFDTQSVKSQMYGSLELNDQLQLLKAETTRHYRKLITADPNVTLEDIKTRTSLPFKTLAFPKLHYFGSNFIILSQTLLSRHIASIHWSLGWWNIFS